MIKLKLYEAHDKMIDLISDDYSILQGLGAFGIRLGFGDKTVSEVCSEQNVDCYTFITVVNFLINGFTPKETDDKISVKTLLGYLRASHRYFLDFQLPTIRRKLEESLSSEISIVTASAIPSPNGGSQRGASWGLSLPALILRLYDDYAHDIRLHMKYEEKTLFPYVEALLRGEQMTNYNVDIFAKHHSDTTGKFHELKNIIIKYLPHDGLANNQLTATLYDIYNNEEWLCNHSNVEEVIFVPAIRRLEQQVRQSDVTRHISDMVFKAGTSENPDALSDREKDVIIALVQGMSNKEIADHLFISINTVITHRRNIARKLQIHSPAGLTIYAIVNSLVDISSVKL